MPSPARLAKFKQKKQGKMFKQVPRILLNTHSSNRHYLQRKAVEEEQIQAWEEKLCKNISFNIVIMANNQAWVLNSEGYDAKTLWIDDSEYLDR